jgi:hypothetical protein
MTFLTACTNDKTTNVPIIDVNLDKLHDYDNFLSYIKDIKLIILEPGPDIFFGTDPQVQYANDEIFLIDKNGTGKIFRFSSEGELINSVGSKGRGPREYIDIKNVQIINDTIIVVTSPQITICKYLKDGSYISKETYEIEAQQAFYHDSILYAYSGFGMQKQFRYISVKLNQINYLVNSKEKVINFYEDTDVFSIHDKNLYTRETYSNTIMSINKTITPYITFNFNKYKIPDDFFKFNSGFEAAEYLFKQRYAVIRKYFETSSLRIVEVLLSGKPVPTFIYGLNFKSKLDKDWTWFSMGKIGESPFINSLKYSVDNKIIFLLDPSNINKLSETEIAKIANRDLLSKITENSNYFIAEFHVEF